MITNRTCSLQAVNNYNCQPSGCCGTNCVSIQSGGATFDYISLQSVMPTHWAVGMTVSLYKLNNNNGGCNWSTVNPGGLVSTHTISAIDANRQGFNINPAQGVTASAATTG